MHNKLPLILLTMFLLPLMAVVALLNTLAVAANPESPQGMSVVATNLSNPRGLTFGPDGALYVAEAGYGGDSEECLPNPQPGDPVCYGPSGAVTRIISPSTSPVQEQVVTGLASTAVITGTDATGPHDVSVDETGNLRVIVGLGADPTLRDSDELRNLGQLVSATVTGTWTNTVDVAAYEVAENPDGAQIDSNPYGLLAVEDGHLVADAGANALLHVSHTGVISTIAVFPTRTVEFPPGSGMMIPMDAVPTAITMGPDGAYYVGQLTGFPYPVGGANVYRVVPGEEPEVYQGGFTNILDVDFDAEGNLYVLEMATNGLLTGDPTGALIRVTPHGLRTTITTDLFLPTGLTIGPDGAAYISNFGIFPAIVNGVEGPPKGPPTGQVIRVTIPPVETSYLPLIIRD